MPLALVLAGPAAYDVPMSGPDPLIPKLAAVVSKVKLYSPEFAHVQYRVFQDDARKGLYFIEVYKGRASRTVRVESNLAANIASGFTDVLLVKEVRTALQTVANQSKELEAKAARISRRH